MKKSTSQKTNNISRKTNKPSKKEGQAVTIQVRASRNKPRNPGHNRDARASDTQKRHEKAKSRTNAVARFSDEMTRYKNWGIAKYLYAAHHPGTIDSLIWDGNRTLPIPTCKMSMGFSTTTAGF